MDYPVNKINDIKIYSGFKNELLNILVGVIERKKQEETFILFTPNPEQIALSYHDEKFKEILEKSDCNLPDGQGIVWSLQKRYHIHIKRISGREVFHELLTLATQKSWKVFFLGGRSGVGNQILRKYGQYNWKANEGSQDISHESVEEKNSVLSSIEEYKPQLLFVAYGAPWQETWLMQNKSFLTKNGVKLAMVVGGSFEYEVGSVPHIPKIVEELHLEWLVRLFFEPWRWKRQLKGLEFFVRELTS